MGPALVTSDEIPDPGNLELVLTLNGAEMQRSNTRNLIFSIPFLIAYLTRTMTLEPGDIIATGTPSGTGASRIPPVFMKPGDRVAIRIERIGELTNPIVAQEMPMPKSITVKENSSMSYFETVPHSEGLNRLPSNPCKLLDFSSLVLSDSQTYQGNTNNREYLAVMLGGRATFEVNGKKFENVGGRPNVFSGKPHSVYIPCQSGFTITARGAAEIALCSAPSTLKTDAYAIAPDKVAAGVWGAANFSRSYYQILTMASQPDLHASRLIVGETFTPSGNWSTFPPHRHEKDDLPREAFHEEMYFFKVSPSDGFGMTRYYNDEVDTGFIVRDNTILMVPKGFHTVVSAPGYTTYYLWFLAGNHRTQATMDDPMLGWVGKTVPMLKALGH